MEDRYGVERSLLFDDRSLVLEIEYERIFAEFELEMKQEGEVSSLSARRKICLTDCSIFEIEFSMI